LEVFMPSRAIPNGQTVTLRLDADLVLRLKMTALQSRVGLSELAAALLGDALAGLKPMAHLEVSPSDHTSTLKLSPTGPTRTPRPKFAAPEPEPTTPPRRLSRDPDKKAQQIEEGQRLYTLVMARYNSVELGKLLGISDSAIRGWDDCVPPYRWEEVRSALAQPEDTTKG
jgi:hypothetical protein